MRMLVADMRAIENQLSNRNRTDLGGKRILSRLYWLWNARAKHALSKMQIEHRFLKDWLRENGDTEKILVHALFAVADWDSPMGTGLSDEYVRKIAAASGYFRKVYRDIFHGEVP
jgi:hypothetical protein